MTAGIGAPSGAHTLPVRVYWEDTDAGGVVYHASHIRFFERGRTEMLRGLGFDQSRVRAEMGLLFAVRRIDIQYLAPGFYDDLLTVETRVTHIGGASFTLSQRLLRDAEIVAEASVTCVAMAEGGGARRLPQAIRDAFSPSVA